MSLESISLFATPNTPDLGCFVRRKHEFEIDQDVDFNNIHLEFSPSIDFNPLYHQVYFRVMCGEAAFFQRCFVYMTYDFSLPPFILQTRTPDWILGGEYTPRPGEWYKYPTQFGERYYWFFGQHRNPSNSQWQADAAVGHSYDIYENGTLSIVRYDDTGGDRDFNDFVLEVAVVGRRSWEVIVQAKDQSEINKKIEKNLSQLKTSLEKRHVKK